MHFINHRVQSYRVHSGPRLSFQDPDSASHAINRKLRKHSNATARHRGRAQRHLRALPHDTPMQGTYARCTRWRNRRKVYFGPVLKVVLRLALLYPSGDASGRSPKCEVKMTQVLTDMGKDGKSRVWMSFSSRCSW